MLMTYMKNGETLSLDGETCIGCGECVNVCPHAVFRIESRKASIHTRAACMECGACARNCPVGALVVKAGVGCAGAIIIGKLRGTAPNCGGGSCGGSTTSCC